MFYAVSWRWGIAKYSDTGAPLRDVYGFPTRSARAEWVKLGQPYPTQPDYRKEVMRARLTAKELRAARSAKESDTEMRFTIVLVKCAHKGDHAAIEDTGTVLEQVVGDTPDRNEELRFHRKVQRKALEHDLGLSCPHCYCFPSSKLREIRRLVCRQLEWMLLDGPTSLDLTKLSPPQMGEFFEVCLWWIRMWDLHKT